MYKLYGIDSYDSSRNSHNCVVLAQDKEEAVKEFYKDSNCRAYNYISKIEEIKGNTCILDYQLGLDIVDFVEKEWELKDIKLGEGVWGRNAFTIVCKDIKKDIPLMKFKSDLVHSSGTQLELMICIADYRPNWVNI